MVGGLGLAAAVHGLLLVAVPLLLGIAAGHRAPLTEPLDWLSRPLTLGTWLHAAWHDWLRPFAPLAWVCVYALTVRRARLLAVTTLVGAACYLTVTAMLVGTDSERGAYLLPLAWPAGLVTVRACSRKVAVALGLAAMALSIVEVRNHDTRPHRAFADGFAEVVGHRRSFVIAGGHDEAASFLIYQPAADWHLPIHELAVPQDALAASLQAYDAWLDGKTADGTELWITAGGVFTLRDPAWTQGRPAGPVLLQHLHDRYVWEEHVASGFVGWRLRPR